MPYILAGVLLCLVLGLSIAVAFAMGYSAARENAAEDELEAAIDDEAWCAFCESGAYDEGQDYEAWEEINRERIEASVRKHWRKPCRPT